MKNAPLSFLSLLVTTVVLLSACGGGAATPTLAPPSLSTGEVLLRTSQVMAEVSSFRFDLETQGGATPIPTGLEMTGAEGVMSQPDRVDVNVKARFSGFVVEVHVISVGEETFMTNPVTGAWQRFESGLSPVAFFDPAQGMALVLDSVSQVSFLPEDTVDGLEAYHLRGRLPASAVQFIAGSFVEGSVLDAELWISREDFHLRRLRLDGQITEGEPPGLVRLLTFSDFDQPFDIQPPI